MATIHKRIEIKAPLSDVYTYIENHNNEPDWLPRMMEVEEVTVSRIRTSYKWFWKIMGELFGEKISIFKNNLGKRMGVKTNWKLIKATIWNYYIITNGDTTILSFFVEYLIPSRMYGTTMENVILKYNEVETAHCLMGIKKRLEDPGLSPSLSISNNNLIKVVRNGIQVGLQDTFGGQGENLHDPIGKSVALEIKYPRQAA